MTMQADLEAEIEEVNGEAEVEKQKEEVRKEIVTAEPKEFTLTTGDSAYEQAKSVEQRYRMAAAFIKGGMVPQSYKNPQQVFAGLEYARELDMKPLSGLRNIAIIHGHPSLWGEAPLHLCLRSGLLKKIEEFKFDKDYNEIKFENKNLNAEPYGAICKTWRDGDDKPYETWFTMDDAKRAGLLGRNNPWKTYPGRMLQMRARSQNLKDRFPDALSGATISEYDYNYIPREGGFIGKTINRRGETIISTADKINESMKNIGEFNDAD